IPEGPYSSASSATPAIIKGAGMVSYGFPARPRRKARERRARLRSPSGRRNRLSGLERLEDRMLPVTISWTGPVSGDWGVAANWTDTSNVHRLPISTDDVSIGGGNTVTHSKDSDSIHSLVSNGSLILSGGTLTDATTLEVTGTFTLSGGTLNQA